MPANAPPLEIRLLQAQDLPALLALYTHLHMADDPLPPEPVQRSVWQGLLADPRNGYLGGFVGDALVASCVLTVIANLTCGCRPYGLIENVVTHADHRQRGYGKALLQAALQIAWDQHCYKVMLLTGRKDEATLRFYENAGFTRGSKQAFIAVPK